MARFRDLPIRSKLMTGFMLVADHAAAQNPLVDATTLQANLDLAINASRPAQGGATANAIAIAIASSPAAVRSVARIDARRIVVRAAVPAAVVVAIATAPPSAVAAVA